ncbi:MAG: hypothetical protein J2P17_34875, partial [Mycobacterium sp.]|nr:hypothetical protein [Mycobacterium sp.]
MRRAWGLIGLLLGGALPLVGAFSAVLPAPVSASDPSVTTCPGTDDPTNKTFTLNGDCTTTAPLTVPDGYTLDGAGHTITGQDPTGGFFVGGIVTNASAGDTINIQNVTISGPSSGFGTNCAGPLNGIFFDDASGTVTNVKVIDVTQHSGCTLGIGIRANGADTAGRTVTLTGVTVTGYQRAGIVASGSMTMNVSGGTIGPPDMSQPASLPAQNGLEYTNTAPNSAAGAGGSVTDVTIYGSNYAPGGTDSTAVLLYGANDVTLSKNTIMGTATNVGVDVTAGSHEVLLDNNTIGASGSPTPGTGVNVDPDSTATLVGNTLSGWSTNLSGVPNCPGTVNGTTIALSGPCTANYPFIVPNGYTLDGGGNTITGQDPSGGFFRGGIVTNGVGGDSFTVQNLTVSGQANGFATDCTGPLTGIFFNDASGSASNVMVKDITQHSGCQLGLGIRANGIGGARAVTLTNVTVTGFQKGGIVASG